MPYKNTLEKYKQVKLARLEIVAKLYKRGYSYADIQREVREQLGMDKGYSLRTVHKDVHTLLEEWKETRIEDVDKAIQAELVRLNEMEKEAWQEWDKSKQDHEKKRAKQQKTSGEGGDDAVRMEQQREEVIGFGDPRYLDIVHKCGIERRKILGLYAPEKKDISGEMSFANFLMETGIIEDEQSEE